MQQQFNETTSLELIESMINRAKDRFNENGTLYLLWGIVIFICSLTQFIAVQFYHSEKVYYIWFLTWLVLLYQVFFLSRKAKQVKVKTYTADILKYVWLCFACCLFLAIFVLQYQHAFNSINPAILILYGVPTFLSGIILRFKPLIIGGISCWALSIGSVLVPVTYQSLFICVAVLVAWIIPGIFLRKRFKNQQ